MFNAHSTLMTTREVKPVKVDLSPLMGLAAGVCISAFVLIWTLV